jgi:signal transduction histidine kinase
VAFVAAAATAVTLGAALADAGDGPIRSVLAVALGSFLVAVAAAGLWSAAVRTGPTDAIVERARTASKLAHEIKNPLMSIRGLASTGARLFDEMSDDERREFFRLIDEEAGRLKRVVEQSATALRVDAQQIVYDMQAEDLGALVEEVTSGSPHDEHPMDVRTEPDIEVRVDRRYLAEALENLIENASKFSPPDAPIDVSTRHDGRTAVIEIADRGPGIPSDKREFVFERFNAWRPAGYEETPGAGLGLFIARAHVLAHDGTIDVVERDDGGSILRVTLPREG